MLDLKLAVSYPPYLVRVAKSFILGYKPSSHTHTPVSCAVRLNATSFETPAELVQSWVGCCDCWQPSIGHRGDANPGGCSAESLASSWQRRMQINMHAACQLRRSLTLLPARSSRHGCCDAASCNNWHVNRYVWKSDRTPVQKISFRPAVVREAGNAGLHVGCVKILIPFSLKWMWRGKRYGLTQNLLTSAFSLGVVVLCKITVSLACNIA